MSIRSGKDRLETFTLRSPGSGAYQVRLTGTQAANTTSIILNGADDQATLELAPGTYTAHIEPVGSNEAFRQTIRLTGGRIEPIQLVDSIFEKGGGAFLRSMAKGVAGNLIGAGAGYIFSKAVNPIRARERPSSFEGEAAEEKNERFQLETKDFSLGLSVKHSLDPEDRYRGGTIRSMISDMPGGEAAITIRRPPDWQARPDWRLTVAVENDRRWRMRVPLFTGGVQLLLKPTQTPDGPDINVSLVPRNSGRAALVANLEHMFLGSATEVIRASLPDLRSPQDQPILDQLLGRGEDPWTVAAAAILLVRAEDTGDDIERIGKLAAHWPWIPDLQILVAWIEARDNTDRQVMELSCLTRLEAAPAHPFFAASLTIGLELLTGLALGAMNNGVRMRAVRLRDKWARTSQRQMPTGAYLSWEDMQTGQSTKLVARNYTTIARGTVGSDGITIAEQAPAADLRSKAPALRRPLLKSDDLWKGRFGGKAKCGGFELSASFARGPDDWVEVDIKVAAERSGAVEGLNAEIFLHESFDPSRLRLPFEDGQIRRTVLAWGGFTIGVWIPSVKIELELDLARVKGAPAAIRNN